MTKAEEGALSTQKSMHDLHGDDLYPCLIVHLGSAHGWLKVRGKEG